MKPERRRRKKIGARRKIFQLSCVILHSFPVSIGFKEWTLVCDALGGGEQSVILRKGGIAEGRAGFRFQHEDFLLFPTLFHEQVSKLKLPSSTPLPQAVPNGQITIKYRVQVEWTKDVTDWKIVRQLAPFHLWQEAEIEKRFHQDDKQSVSLAFVRASRFSQPFVLPDSPRYGGCRSWVQLPEVPAEIATSFVIDEAIHRDRERQLKAALGR